MITYNGSKVAEYEENLAGFIQDHGYNLSHIAVELNGEIVKHIDYAKTELKQGDVLEIVTFVGGG